jgi:predicted esterase
MRESRFAENTQQLMTLAAKGDFTEAHELISKMKIEFTEKLDQISFWQACLYTIKGEIDSAINELQSTLDQGYWWNPDSLRNDPDLSPLKMDQRFNTIIQSCEDTFEFNKKRTRAIVEQFGNPASDIVVIVLHWRGSNTKSFSEYWVNQEIERRYRFIFIQSSQLFGYNSYCWDDYNIVKDDLLKCLSGLDLSNKQIILAGASQGASIAIDLILEELEVQGFIAIVPAIKDIKGFEQKVLNTNIKNKSGFILTGAKDPYYEKSIEVASILNEKGIRTELIVKEDLGHFFPNDFNSIELDAIKYLTQ